MTDTPDLDKHRFTPDERSEFKTWIEARTGLEWSQQSAETYRRLFVVWMAERKAK